MRTYEEKKAEAAQITARLMELRAVEAAALRAIDDADDQPASVVVALRIAAAPACQAVEDEVRRLQDARFYGNSEVEQIALGRAARHYERRYYPSTWANVFGPGN